MEENSSQKSIHYSSIEKTAFKYLLNDKNEELLSIACKKNIWDSNKSVSYYLDGDTLQTNCDKSRPYNTFNNNTLPNRLIFNQFIKLKCLIKSIMCVIPQTLVMNQRLSYEFKNLKVSKDIFANSFFFTFIVWSINEKFQYHLYLLLNIFNH